MIPNTNMIDDQTEAYRRQRLEELNAVGWPREVLEAKANNHEKVWSTEELQAEFEIRTFLTPPARELVQIAS